MAVQARALGDPTAAGGTLGSGLRSSLLPVLAVFFLSRVVLFVVGWLASIVIPIDVRVQPYDPHLDAYWLSIWAQGDVGRYLGIVADGYRAARPEQLALFPLYPLLVGLVRVAAGNAFFAGVVIANLAFLAALILLFRLARQRYDDATAHRAVFYLAVYPGALFTLTAYADGLFLALSLASFLLFTRQRWGLGALFGALGTATRLSGVAIALAWVVEFVRWHSAARQRPGFGALGILLLLAGIGAISLVFYLLVGDPLAYVRPSAWNGAAVPMLPWATVRHAVEVAQGQHLIAGFEERYVANVLNLAFGAVFLLLTPLVFWRVGLTYGVYLLFGLIVPLVLTPLADRPLDGMVRSGLAFFPIFMLLADWGRRAFVDRLILALFVLVLGLMTVLFVSSWYVG